jgi:hypothetical protein
MNRPCRSSDREALALDDGRIGIGGALRRNAPIITRTQHSPGSIHARTTGGASGSRNRWVLCSAHRQPIGNCTVGNLPRMTSTGFKALRRSANCEYKQLSSERSHLPPLSPPGHRTCVGIGASPTTQPHWGLDACEVINRYTSARSAASSLGDSPSNRRGGFG